MSPSHCCFRFRANIKEPLIGKLISQEELTTIGYKSTVSFYLPPVINSKMFILTFDYIHLIKELTTSEPVVTRLTTR